MSCVLRVRAQNLESVLKSTDLRPYRVENGWAHFDVSKATIANFSRQVADAIGFLEANAAKLERLAATGSVEATLDFAVAWRDVAVHTDFLPAELVRRAAEFGFAVELSQYPLAEGE